MDKGIKVVKPGVSISTNVPTNVAVDSRQPGAMKIYKKIVVEENVNELTSVKLNTVGVKEGTFIYRHNLGYAPAFLMYETAIADGFPTITKLLPDLGPFGSPFPTNGFSDKETVTVRYLRGDSNEVGFGQRWFLTLYVFAEDLDAEV